MPTLGDLDSKGVALIETDLNLNVNDFTVTPWRLHRDAMAMARVHGSVPLHLYGVPRGNPTDGPVGEPDTTWRT